MENIQQYNSTDLFGKAHPDSSMPHSHFIANDEIVNLLITQLSSHPSREAIDSLLKPLAKNFVKIRMNAARFNKSSSKDIFEILFDLYLSFDDEQSPPETIITLFHILLYYGSNQTNAFDWLFNTISNKIRNDTLSPICLLNFIRLVKEVYLIREDPQRDIPWEKESKALIASSSYFYFYPGSSSLRLDLKTNKELDLNKGLGFSIWFKFPFSKDNIAIFNKENLIDSSDIVLIKIEFYNNQVPPIILKLCFIKGDYKQSILSLVAFSNTQSIYLSLNDILMHLHFVINIQLQVIEIFINGSLMTTMKLNKFQMKQIIQIELMKNFIGEVRSIVMYSQFNSCKGQTSSLSDLGKLDSFVSFYNELTDQVSAKQHLSNIALAYFPYANGENVFNYYANNSDYSFLFDNKLSGVYNHCSSKDQVCKWFNEYTYLPIFEYLYKKKHDKAFSALNENIIMQLLDIIKETFVYSNDHESYSCNGNSGEKTTTHTSEDNFFFILSMFLEKMPNSLFTLSFGKKIIDLVLELKTMNSGRNHENFIRHILLNEKIMYKYQSSFVIWKDIFALSIADERIASLCTINELIKGLLYFDKHRFSQMCCCFHKDAFDFCSNLNINADAEKEDKNEVDHPKQSISVSIMKPELNDKIKEVIQLINNKITYKSIQQDKMIDSKTAKEERIQAQVMLSKLFHFNLSPCLIIKLLEVLKRSASTDNDVLNNCMLSLSLPLLDVKNAGLNFVLNWIEKVDHLKPSSINVGLIIKNYFLPQCMMPVKHVQGVKFAKEYVDSSIKNTMMMLMKWIVLTNKNNSIFMLEYEHIEKDNDLMGFDLNSNINNGNSLMEEWQRLIDLLIAFQLLIKKLKVFEPFFQEVIDIITDQIASLNSKEKSLLKTSMDHEIFQKKFAFVFYNNNAKNQCSYQMFYSKILFIYYYLTISEPTSVIKMRNQLVNDISWFMSSIIKNKEAFFERDKPKDRALSVKRESKLIRDKEREQESNIETTDNRLQFADIIIEKTISYLKSKNNITTYGLQHCDLIKMILSAFNYYITNCGPIPDQIDDIYRHLNLREINNKSAVAFFDNIFDYYQCLWDKEVYHIANVLIAIVKSNKQKVTQNGLQFINTLTEEQKIFTITVGDPQYSYSLIMVICFIFISKIAKAKDEERLSLITKFKDYLIFVLIISVVTVKITPKAKELNTPSININISTTQSQIINMNQTRKNNSFFYEVIASGLELILTYEKENKGSVYAIHDFSSEVTYCLLYFYDLYSPGNKNVFESLFDHTHNVNLQNPVFIELITQMKEDKSNKDSFNETLFKLKQDKGRIDPKNAQFPFLLKTLLYSTLKERLRATRTVIQHFFLLSAKSSVGSNKTMCSESEVIEARNNCIEQYKTNVRDELTRNFINERFKRKRYKQIKNELCLWNRPWSVKECFYTKDEVPIEDFVKLDFSSYPKSKILNHYSKSFTRPFIVPVIDMTYHLPDFCKFKKEKMFNDGDVNGSNGVCINIDRILDDDYKPITQNKDKPLQIEPKAITEEEKNALYYLCNTSTEPDLLYSFTQAIRDDETMTKPSKSTCEQLKLKRSNIDPSSVCCLVKSSRHIKGKFKLIPQKQLIEFMPLINKTIYIDPKDEQRDIDFDKIRGTCFGSYVKQYPKDNNRVYYTIGYNTITHLFAKKYFFRNTGLELFTSNNKSYYFNFLSEKKRNDVFESLQYHLKDKGNVYSFEDDHDFKYNAFYSKWRTSKISTMHWLELINAQANRSYNDISQYPVFPWVYTNYSIETVPNEEKDFRNFATPIGMMELERYPKSTERALSYIDNYQSLVEQFEANEDENNNEEENGGKAKGKNKGKDNNYIMSLPYFYGSHYSNPMYVTQFLTRLFPMGDTLIELQGDKFDDPNRLFLSVERCFESVVSLKGDIRELVPQFFYLPEFFLNINNFNMGVTRSKSRVHNAECPIWSQRNPFNFVLELRKFLEGDYVNANLHSWIDLIFGYKQQGEEALKAKNIFVGISYINDVSIDEKDTKDKQEYIFRVCEFGLSPKQLFKSPCEAKIAVKSDEVKAIAHITSLRKDNSNHRFLSFDYNSKIGSPFHLAMLKCVSNGKVLFYYSNGSIEKMNYSIVNKTSEIVKCKLMFGHKLLLAKSASSSAFKLPLLSNRIGAYYEYHHLPIVALDKGEMVIQGGFYDGSMLLSISDKAIEHIKAPNEIFASPICIIIADKEENIVMAGTHSGLIHIYQRNNKANAIGNNSLGSSSQFELIETLNIHHSIINHISISYELNAFASSAEDNYVHVYAMPSNKLIRSLKVGHCQQVFLSDSPLPSIVVYSSVANGRFACYSLNGFLLKHVPEEDKPSDPRVIKDASFFDYLIYTTNKMTITIRSFPYMDIVYSVTLIQDSNCFGACFYDITSDMKAIVAYSVRGKNIFVIRDFTN